MMFTNSEHRVFISVFHERPVLFLRRRARRINSSHPIRTALPLLLIS